VLKKVIAGLAGIILIVLGFMLSVALIFALAFLGLVAWGYVWWQGRKLRQTVPVQSTGGHVIEGEATVIEVERAEIGHVVPNRQPGQ
jgi:membrane protein implicated in regulation of membrane protease activity